MKKFSAVFSVLSGTVLCAAPVRPGLWKTFTYDRPDTTPIVFGGESRARNVRAVDYCVFLDLYHPDGSATWNICAHFDQGTHGWQKVKRAYVPKKPVSRIEAHALCRRPVDAGTPCGEADFRDFFLERREGESDVVDLLRVSDRPYSAREEISFNVFEGKVFRPRRVSLEGSGYGVSPLPAGSAVVWTCDSMRRVTPLTFPSAADRAAPPRLAFDLARRGAMSAQLNVSTAADTAWSRGSLRIVQPADARGRKLKGRVGWRRVGYIPRTPGYRPHPAGPPREERWIPEPLLPPAPFRVRKGATQGLWITVETSADADAGEYTGAVEVLEGGTCRATVPVTVRVRKFGQPATFGLKTSFSLMDGFLRMRYPRTWRRMRRRAIDVILDHRLNPDDISRTTPPEIDDLLHMRARGMNHFTILNIVPPPKDPGELWTCYVPAEAVFNDAFYPAFSARLRPYVAELRRHGLEKSACLYGFDERGREYYAGIGELWRKLRRDFPDIPVMTTSTLYGDYAALWKEISAGKTNAAELAVTDIHCPVSSTYDEAVSAHLRTLGRSVWWYTCCGPWAPWANMASYEFPPIEGRILLGAMTYAVGAEGYLFWHVNFWLREGNDPMDVADTFFPDWSTEAVSSACAGDGILVYPGKDDIYPSIRLAQMRDGVQDYEWLSRLASRAGRAAAEKFAREIAPSPVSFTRDPAKLLEMRRRLGDALEGF